MIKTLIFFAFLLAIAFGGAWLADRPGEIVINWPWLDMGFEISLLMGFLLVVAAMALAVILWVFVKGIWNSPKSVAGFFSGRRRDKGYKALSTGMIAVGVGDLALARKQAIKARKLIGEEPMTLMLEAQTAQLAGDVTKARQSFESMLELDETRALGHRGLYIEAQRRGDVEEAMEMAKAATGEGQKSPGWAGTALFDMQTASEDWQGALITLSQNFTNKHISRVDFRRKRAVILTAQAQALEGEDNGDASMRSLLQEACKLAPNLVPAVSRYAQLLNDVKDYRKASKLVEAAWRASPHPDLARVYAYIKDGETAVDRLKRIRVLYGLMPDHVESKLAMARAFIDAREWAEARNVLGDLARDNLTPRVCMLMAELEEGENNDFGRVRQWLARSVGAHRDPVWTADGQVSNVWKPISPVTGKIDAFEWKVPVRELAQSEQPVLDSRDIPASEDELSDEDMVLLPLARDAEKKAADEAGAASKASFAKDEEPEDIVVEPVAETDVKDTVSTGDEVKVAAKDASAVEVGEAELSEPDSEEEGQVSEPTSQEDEVVAEADAEPVQKGDDKAIEAEALRSRIEAKKPHEVEFPLPSPPDDPGPRQDPLPGSPEKRFRLF
ncbi:heme biosynthesis HemY N-terminal domain-containing protein [uncultured Cohaesibacter sp.]|uniref:heme biosynthesis protein HemY n=1 Tax=uncultured Cohaesibacter sp. TaxID=1002546 RepID=UPI00292CED65|nr:heme biosynthesis HemY N-terminal domain-containing protein [uncultured Cohaesibacter sp.]